VEASIYGTPCLSLVLFINRMIQYNGLQYEEGALEKSRSSGKGDKMYVSYLYRWLRTVLEADSSRPCVEHETMQLKLLKILYIFEIPFRVIWVR
jgi:hypothetical protein